MSPHAEPMTTQVVMVREGFWRSLASDAMSFGTLLAMVGVGVLIDSAAMQWVGGIIWVFWLFSRTAAIKGRHRLEPQAAADWLFSEYGVRAKP